MSPCRQLCPGDIPGRDAVRTGNGAAPRDRHDLPWIRLLPDGVPDKRCARAGVCGHVHAAVAAHQAHLCKGHRGHQGRAGQARASGDTYCPVIDMALSMALRTCRDSGKSVQKSQGCARMQASVGRAFVLLLPSLLLSGSQESAYTNRHGDSHAQSRNPFVTSVPKRKFLRGAQGEFEEARELIKRMGAENKLMHAILSRGRSLVTNLQVHRPD